MKVALCYYSIELQLHINELCRNFFRKENISAEIDKFLSGQALLKATTTYDLILLDVDMPGLTGIEIGLALREKSQDVEIIYISSSAKYAIDGYQVQAFHYLLENELDHTFYNCMTSVMMKIKTKKRKQLFQFVEGHISISLDYLIYVESQASRLVFHVCHQGDAHKSTYHLYGKIDDIQEDISGLGFIRTNQSYLVNSLYIREVKCYYTELTNGEILSIPKARYSHVKERYALYKANG